MEIENVATEQVVNEQPQQTETEVQSEPKFTQAEVDKIVQKRLAKEQAKFEQRLNALEESQKLNAMSEVEKANYQAQKERESFEEERKKFYEERDAFNKAQYKSTIEQQLQSKGLPINLAGMLSNLSAEEVSEQIKEIEQAFNQSVNTRIDAQIKQSAKVPTTNERAEELMTLEQIKGLSQSEYNAQKELVERSLKAIYNK